MGSLENEGLGNFLKVDKKLGFSDADFLSRGFLIICRHRMLLKAYRKVSAKVGKDLVDNVP